MSRCFSIVGFLIVAAVVPSVASAFECVDTDARLWSRFIAADTGDCAVNEAEGRCMDLEEVEVAVETDAAHVLDAADSRKLPITRGGSCSDYERCHGAPTQPVTRLAARAPQTTLFTRPTLCSDGAGWCFSPALPDATGLGEATGHKRLLEMPPQAPGLR